MAADEIVFKSVDELAALLKARQLSPVELVQAFLTRIDAVNPKVSAFITITGEAALGQARLAERGDRCRPLSWPAAWHSLCPKRSGRHQRHPHDERLEGNRQLGPGP